MDLDKLQEEVEFDNNLLITMFKHILHLQQQFDEAEYDSSMRDGIEEHLFAEKDEFITILSLLTYPK